MYLEWRPYVPVAKRRANAASFAQKLAKKEGRQLAPISIAGRKITSTFWGNGWCDNLERYSDFANRLPRGRTYVRNGSVVDLLIEPGLVRAYVAGSDVYQVKIEIARLKPKAWKQITGDCAASIDSLLDLLGGRFSDGVMQRLMRLGDGLFPQPAEIKIGCSCPDWAVLCKHAAAVLYGVGARLDGQPELLFRLRDVDQAELVGHAVSAENLDRALGSQAASLKADDLSELFGIEIESAAAGRSSGRKKRLAKPERGQSQKAKAAAPHQRRKQKLTVPQPPSPGKLSAAKKKSARALAGVTLRKSAKKKASGKPPAITRKKAKADGVFSKRK